MKLVCHRSSDIENAFIKGSLYQYFEYDGYYIVIAENKKIITFTRENLDYYFTKVRDLRDNKLNRLGI